MNHLNQWYESQFLPWKKSVEAYKDEQGRMLTKVQEHSAELKYVVSLLLEKREEEAVKVWNELELQPELQSIQLDLAKDELVLITTGKVEQKLSLDTLLEELQGLLA